MLTAVLLALSGLAAGIGITAVGPGGVLATIGLFAFTALPPAEVAGTAIATHIATGLLGTAVYVHSGQLREAATRRTAVILAATAVLGTPVGVLVNSAVSGRAFGVLLAVFVTVIAVLVWYRDRRAGPAAHHHPTVLLAGIGFGVAAAGGVFGVGGPMLAVPLLVLIGTGVLPALAAAQVQSVVISTVGTAGYLVRGAVDWRLALLVGVPELCGVVLGWKLARAVPARRLTCALIVSLLALAPYLALHG
ncbi:sulfite exporter TauE/SafE family protein [Saccharopolyspora taberi]|uniref:Probable membrane transporter protein n=1 Tax=Saccharopolyspora taberi TaxID=60895 RepID=A0ABN3VD01_9PSEU